MSTFLRSTFDRHRFDPPLNIAMAPSMEQGIEVIIPAAPLLTMPTAPVKIQFAPEIITGLGSMLLALKNRSSHLRIQARAPRSLKIPRSKQGCVGIIEAMEPIVIKPYCLG